MTSDPRGKVVIINNTNFTMMSERGGSNFDAVNLSELFRKLNFAVDIWDNVTAKVCLDTFTFKYCHYALCLVRTRGIKM